MIRIDAAWFAVEPLDMRAGVDTALACVMSDFNYLGARTRTETTQKTRGSGPYRGRSN